MTDEELIRVALRTRIIETEQTQTGLRVRLAVLDELHELAPGWLLTRRPSRSAS